MGRVGESSDPHLADRAQDEGAAWAARGGKPARMTIFRVKRYIAK
jgi:hypothetical protein